MNATIPGEFSNRVMLSVEKVQVRAVTYKV